MPTQVDRIERGIYCSRWIGIVSLTDQYHENAELVALAQADGVSGYVYVIDARDVASFPMTPQAAIKTIPDEMIAMLVINSPTTGKILGRLARPLLSIPLKFYRNYENLLEDARQLLTAHESNNSSPIVAR